MQSSYCSDISVWGMNWVHNFSSPKSSVIILWTVSLSMWSHSANILIVERQSSAKTVRTFATHSSVQLVRGCLALGLSSTLSRLLQNLPYHSKLFVRDRHSLLYTFCNILNVSVAVNSFLKQSCITISCSRCVFHDNRRKERIGKHLLATRCLILQYWNFVSTFERLQSTCFHLSHIDSATHAVLIKSVLKLYSYTVYFIMAVTWIHVFTKKLGCLCQDMDG